MKKQIDFKALNNKLDFLLRDHKVNFDNSQLNLETLNTLHRKADALLTAHNCIIPEGDDSVRGLQPKLNMLIQGHGKEFNESGLDLNNVDTVHKKLDTLIQAHGHNE